MKRCTKCILPENYPGITFNDKGVCKRCEEWLTEYKKVDYKKLRANLDKFIARKKNEAKQSKVPYDVIVPISGGKDSAYVLYVMKKVYNCRILAINYNNTFQTELAYKNIQNLVDVFDVDFRMINLRPSLIKKAYKAGMKQQGEFCIICNCTGYWLMLSFLKDLFNKYNYIPLIVGGWSRLYEYDPQINTLDFGKYKNILVKSGLLNEFLKVLDKEVFEELTGKGDVREQKSGGFIQLPDYWPWDHNKILFELQNVGWQKMKDKDTHFDCWASPLADKIEQVKYGLNQKTTILASYVRAGKMKRKSAELSEKLSLIEPIDEHLLNRFSNHIRESMESMKLLIKPVR
jgi:hypothetical protein